jgi:hypothetical protein
MSTKHKQNWISHVDRMDSIRFPNTSSIIKLEEEIVDVPGNNAGTGITT